MTQIRLPSSTVPGFARAVSGEELEYHSPIPGVTRSLVVRSEDEGRSIAWETAPVPTPTQLGAVDRITFVMLAGIDANDDRRSFELSIDGKPVLKFTNPEAATEGVLKWEGDDGVRAEFRITLVDRYADAMGYLFLHVPRRFVRPGRPLHLEVSGESVGTRTWFMLFTFELAPGIAVRPVPAVVRSPDGPLQELRIDLVRLDEGGTVALPAESRFCLNSVTRSCLWSSRR